MQKWEYLELLYTSSTTARGVVKFASVNDEMITNFSKSQN
jgi:hypothetical protein